MLARLAVSLAGLFGVIMENLAVDDVLSFSWDDSCVEMDEADNAVDEADNVVDGAGKVVDKADRVLDEVGRVMDEVGRVMDGAGNVWPMFCSSSPMYATSTATDLSLRVCLRGVTSLCSSASSILPS
jgi:hypothetical protein